MGKVKATLGTDVKSSDVKRKPRKKSNLKNLDKRLRAVEIEVQAKEMKFHDNDIPRTAPLTINSGTSTLINLTEIANGTGNQQRIGDSVNVRSLFVKMLFDHNGAGSVAPQVLRMLLFKGKRPDQTAPQLGDIVQNSAAGSSIYSPYDKAQIGGFKILKDEMFTLINADSMEVRSFEYYWQNPRLEETTFTGPDGTVGQRILNHYYMILISDQVSNGPSASGWIRLNYTDA